MKHFFDEIDIFSNSCGLTPAEKIQHTLWYLEWKEYETWKSHPSAQGHNWDDFKQEIFALYPGADEDQKYTLVDLEILTDRQAQDPMHSCYQFREYYQSFVTISDWLILHGEISRREHDTIFFSGFDTTMWEKLTSHLRLKNPDHPLHQPWNMEDVAEAAQFFLSSNSAVNGPGTYPLPLRYLQAPYESPALPEPPTAHEMFDMSSLEQFVTSDAFLNKLASKLSLGNHTASSHAPPNTAPH